MRYFALPHTLQVPLWWGAILFPAAAFCVAQIDLAVHVLVENLCILLMIVAMALNMEVAGGGPAPAFATTHMTILKATSTDTRSPVTIRLTILLHILRRLWPAA
jgi:hypothetical protein